MTVPPIDYEDLDPSLYELGRLTGLFQKKDSQGNVQITSDWFTQPGHYLNTALSDVERSDAVFGLLSALLGSGDPQVLGLPLPSTAGELWYPINDTQGEPTGLYLVGWRDSENYLYFSLATRWETTVDSLKISLWGQVPFLRTKGSSSTTDFILANPSIQSKAPVRLAAEVVKSPGEFGSGQLKFTGVKLAGDIYFSKAPQVSFTFQNLQLPDGKPPSNRSLSDLTSLGGQEWVDLAISLFLAQISADPSNDPNLAAVRDHLLPLLGLGSNTTSLHWEEIVTKQEKIFTEWFEALVSDSTKIGAWLGHWGALLQGGGAALAPTGSGSRSDPWRVKVPLGASQLNLCLTMASVTESDGSRTIYPGIWVSSPDAVIAGDICLGLQVTGEIAAIHPKSTPGGQPLPSLDAGLRLYNKSGGRLVDVNLGGHAELSFLGQFQLDEMRIGLTLDANQRPVPAIYLKNLTCARGTWPLLDLSSADSTLEGLNQAVGSFIQDQLQAVLGSASATDHAGRHLAALLGIIAPTDPNAPAVWPVPLVASGGSLSTFLGDPLATVGCYHSACLETQSGGAPAWRFLLYDLFSLLRHVSAPVPALSGTGSESDPWKYEIYSGLEGKVSLQAWSAVLGGRPQLTVALDLAPVPVDLGGGVSLALHVQAQLLHCDLPASANCPDNATATWLPGLSGRLEVSGNAPIQLSGIAGLTLSVRAVALAAEWHHLRGFSWTVTVKDPLADWTLDSLQLPDFKFGTGFSFNWDLSLPDFGLGLDVGKLRLLLRFLIGFSLINWGGGFGFSLAGLLGLLPDLPHFSFPGLPSWDLGPFRLPFDWPKFEPSNCATFFTNPWPEIRLHLGKLFGNFRFAWPALNWLGGAFHLQFPDFSFPDLNWPSLGGGDGLSFPTLNFEVGGEGTYANPWWLTLYRSGAQQWQALAWLDPEGPPSGEAIDVMLGLLPTGLQSLNTLVGNHNFTYAQLITILQQLSNLDESLRKALGGAVPANLAGGLTSLEQFLSGSDGAVVCVSQQPPVQAAPDPSGAPWAWNAVEALATLPEATHWDQLQNAQVLTAIQGRINAWSGANDLPVLLLEAPWESAAAWNDLLTLFGNPGAGHFDLMEFGTDPAQISLATQTHSGRFYTADLAIFNTSASVPVDQRAIPVYGRTNSQAAQVLRLVDRIRELHPGKQVIIVAHSTSGLAAREMITTAGDAVKVRGLVTIGTPHVTSPLPWQNDSQVREALGFLNRLNLDQIPNALVKQGLQKLLGWLNAPADGQTLATLPQAPAHIFSASGPHNLPNGVSGHAIATRLPTATLRDQLLGWLQSRLADLRAVLENRSAPTHLGLGLRCRLPVTAPSAVQVLTETRLDLYRLPLHGNISDSGYLSIPRLSHLSQLSRQDGWLVGQVGASPRLRAAELGFSLGLSAGGDLTPVVRLYDGHVDGVSQLDSQLQLASGAYDLPVQMRRQLEEMLSILTRSGESTPAVNQLCSLLEALGLTRVEGSGYNFHLPGWDTFLADPQAALQTRLNSLLANATQRDAFFTNLSTLLGLGWGDLDRLLVAQTNDSEAIKLLRLLFSELGFLGSQTQGFPLDPAGLLQYCAAPVATLRTAVTTLMNDATRRTGWIQTLRTKFNLTDASAPAVTALGSGVSLEVTPAGKLTLTLLPAAALQFGPAFQLYGSFSLDFSLRKLELALKLRPGDYGAAVAAVYSLALGAPQQDAFKLQLVLGQDGLPAAYPPLDLYPVPGDLAQTLGELLPRRVLSSFAAAFLESQLIARRPEAGSFLQSLGLAYRKTVAANWQVRNLDGLLLDPATWLKSSLVLGDATGNLSATKALAAVENLRQALNLPGPANSLSLPYGLRLSASAPSGLQLDLQTQTPLALPDNGTLNLALSLSVSPSAQVGAGGQATLHFNLPALGDAPSLWSQLVLQTGYTSGQFTLALGTDAALIQLVPFAGWSSTLLGMSGNAVKLLPTMVKATIEGMKLSGSAAVVSLANDLCTAATALQIDSLAGLQTLAANPVGWLQGRFASGAAAVSATAIQTLLSTRLAGLSRSSGLLTYQPVGSPVTVTLGRASGAAGGIGVRLALVDLSAGPLEVDLSLSVKVDDQTTPSLSISTGLELAVKDNVLSPGGVSLMPSLGFSYTSPSTFDLHLYPLGNDPGSPDFRLDILPTFQFRCEGGNLSDCLASFAQRVLAPLVLEMFLDDNTVTVWLNTPLVAGAAATRPGQILVDSQVLTAVGGGYNLKPLDQFPSAVTFVQNLFGSGLEAFYTGLNNGNTPLVDLTSNGEAGGIYLARKQDGGANLYGLRLLLPSLEITDDPEVELVLGGDASWVQEAGGPAGSQAGITLYLLRKQGNAFSFRLDLDLVSIGINFSGKNDDPLFSASGFQLGGIDARMYLSLTNVTSNPGITGGFYARLSEVGLPLGAAGGNSVAQSLLGGGGASGDSTAVNPTFSVGVGYINNLYVDLGSPGSNEVWFPIQASFGPVHVEQIGIGWQQSNYTLSLLVDGGVTIEGLAVGFDDLSVNIPVKEILDVSKWSLGLRGLAVGYSGGGVRISGGLRQVGTDSNLRYDGLCLVEVAGRTFVALGSYMKDPYTSMFVFVVLPIVLGGPPYLFIIGLAGGFGYNRSLEVPPVADIPEFPLVAAARGDASFSDDPMSALIALGTYIAPRRGSYWVAAGIRFTSFELADSVAMIYLLLDRGLEIGLLGMTQMQLPKGAPLVNIELALKARFSTREGVMSVEARLTDNSWLLHRDCRLTGGFAFYVWFAGTHRGDFVITIGGYHPRFRKPSHFPDVPRLGFLWQVSSCITIKGESYFALTNSAVMAGGLLEAVYKSGNLKAWFIAYAHFLISWDPFYYDIEIGISIGVSYRLKVWLLFGSVTINFKLELGARVWIWGPEFSGEVEVTWWVISFTFGFGAGADKQKEEKISWDEFRQRFLPENDSDLLGGFVEKGLLEEVKSGETVIEWKLQPEFMLHVETTLGTSQVRLGAQLQAGTKTIDVGPMQFSNITSELQISLKKYTNATTLGPAEYITNLQAQKLGGNLPAALWDWLDEDGKLGAETIPSWVGVRLVADIQEHTLKHTGELQVKKIYEYGIQPLPFTQELFERLQSYIVNQAAMANTLQQLNRYDAATIYQAQWAILTDTAWQVRRQQVFQQLSALGITLPAAPRLASQTSPVILSTRRRSPPQIASLYEGLATEAVADVPLTPVPRPPVPERVQPWRVPRLQAVLHQRPEPTRQCGQAIRTTVSGLANSARYPRVNVAVFSQEQMGKQLAASSTLKRQAAPQAAAAIAIAVRSPAFINDGFATPKQREQFRSLQARAAISRQALGLAAGAPFEAIFTPAALGEANDKARGVLLTAGATQVWEVPSRDCQGEPPTCYFQGNQAIRLTCLDRGNALLEDREQVGSGAFTLPPETARFVVTGLGKPAAGREDKASRMGAVSLEQATHPVSAVGWLGSNELMQVGRSALLARGAVIKTAAPLHTRRQGRRVDQAVVSAGEALMGQNGVETMLPREINTIGILIERRDLSAADSLSRDLAITVQGATLSAEPIAVVGGERAMLLYDVLEVKEDARWICLGVATKTGWRLDGVVGLHGNALHWAKSLATLSLASLVEDGPLTPQGQTRLVFTVDQPEGE